MRFVHPVSDQRSSNGCLCEHGIHFSRRHYKKEKDIVPILGTMPFPEGRVYEILITSSVINISYKYILSTL